MLLGPHYDSKVSSFFIGTVAASTFFPFPCALALKVGLEAFFAISLSFIQREIV